MGNRTGLSGLYIHHDRGEEVEEAKKGKRESDRARGWKRVNLSTLVKALLNKRLQNRQRLSAVGLISNIS